MGAFFTEHDLLVTPTLGRLGVQRVPLGLVRLLRCLLQHRLQVGEGRTELGQARVVEVVVQEVGGVRVVGAPAEQVEGQLAAVHAFRSPEQSPFL